MSEQEDAATPAPTPRDLAAVESRLARDGAIPDAVFAEPWFGRGRAGFGLLAGRNQIVEVSVGPEGRELRIGRFTGTRRRATTTAGAAAALGLSFADTEGLLDDAERALRAGIAAYQDTFRALRHEAARTSEGVVAAPAADAGKTSAESAAPATPLRPLGPQVASGIAGPQTRPRRPGSHRNIAPIPYARPGRDEPGRPGGLSL